MLLEKFYEIISKEDSENKSLFSIDIKINKFHPIFKGHFPDNPVVPGVCMLQIIKEITEEIVNSKLFMQKCINVKFMAIINPEVNSDLNLELSVTQEDGGIVKVKNITKFEETIALKMSAQYRMI
jgi:3-hydroxyacyl-[acyl-carrier-protein] dehydratase